MMLAPFSFLDFREFTSFMREVVNDVRYIVLVSCAIVLRLVFFCALCFLPSPHLFCNDYVCIQTFLLFLMKNVLCTSFFKKCVMCN
jgi:hypothetical protein